MGKAHKTGGKSGAPRHPRWQRLLAQPEGKVLAAGLIGAVTYAVGVFLTRLLSPHVFHSMLSMTLTHIAAGRAAGIIWGFEHKLDAWLVIVGNMGIETVLVLLFYSLFVFSYRRLLIIKPLEAAIERVRRTAEAHHKAVMKYGVPGLFLFAFFPFYLTGPLVGSAVGFIVGFRPLVNLSVVLAGTYVAIVCWALFLHRVTQRLEAYGPYVPFVLVGVLFFVGLGLRIRSWLRKAKGSGP